MAIEVKTVKATKNAAEIKEYWTPERIKAAKPISRKPSKDADQAAQDASPDEKGGGAKSGKKRGKAPAGTVGAAPEIILISEPVTTPQQYPWRCVGKLFFTMDGNDKSASASAFGKNVILTAAHCLHNMDDGQDLWAENVIFVPAYTSGEEPYGSWTYSGYIVPQSWNEGQGDAFDFGTVTLNKGGNANQSIGDALGYLGYITQLPFEQEWTCVGYPDSQSNGEVMAEETGAFTRTLEHNTIIGKKGDMSFGASGGPWLLQYELGLRINGVQSFVNDEFPGEVFSAYFGEYAAEFLHDTTS